MGSGGCVPHRCSVFFFQAEDGIRYLVRSRGLGDVYKRQLQGPDQLLFRRQRLALSRILLAPQAIDAIGQGKSCLLYTSDAADERSSVDLGGRRIITKKNKTKKKAVSRHTQQSLEIHETVHSQTKR